jgi:hypothetical protein
MRDVNWVSESIRGGNRRAVLTSRIEVVKSTLILFRNFLEGANITVATAAAPRRRDTDIIPALELRKAEKKCTILAELEEDFRHIIDNLERRYGVKVRVEVIRPVVGGGAGSERILLSAIQEVDAQTS